MKKALTVISGVIIFGAFSFAEAAVVYSQPSGTYQVTSSVSSTISAGVILGTFVAGGAHVLTGSVLTSALGFGANETGYVCVYNDTDGTHIACTDSSAVASSSAAVQHTYTLIAANQSGTTISGKTYTIRLVAGTNGFTGYRLTNSSGAPFVVLTDDEGGSVPPNWGAISVSPVIDFSAIQYVATSTSIFSGTTSSSTLEAIALECADSGNIFSKAFCRAFSYLFIPNPAVLNQYTTIGPTLETKFPVSWFYQLQSEINTVSTTTLSSPVWTMNLGSIGIGSTTSMGNFLPNLTIFSSSTVKTYISESNWQLLLTLAGASIWLLAFYTLYAIGHKLFTGHRQSV